MGAGQHSVRPPRWASALRLAVPVPTTAFARCSCGRQHMRAAREPRGAQGSGVDPDVSHAVRGGVSIGPEDPVKTCRFCRGGIMRSKCQSLQAGLDLTEPSTLESFGSVHNTYAGNVRPQTHMPAVNTPPTMSVNQW